MKNFLIMAVGVIALMVSEPAWGEANKDTKDIGELESVVVDASLQTGERGGEEVYGKLKAAKLQRLNDHIEARRKSGNCYRSANTIKLYGSCAASGKKPTFHNEEEFHRHKAGTLRYIDMEVSNLQKNLACVQAATNMQEVRACGE